MAKLIEAEDAYQAIEEVGEETQTPCRDYLDAAEYAPRLEADLIDADALVEEIMRIGEENEIGSVDYADAIESLAKKRGRQAIARNGK